VLSYLFVCSAKSSFIFILAFASAIYILKVFKDRILSREFHKALAKTLFHFFSAVGLCVGKKNESVFCALAKIF